MFALSTSVCHTVFMPDPQRYHHGDLRSTLLRASLELIREVGIRGFTLREVARRAGVSHAAPYRHFRDKAELLAAIAEDGFNSLTAAMRSAAAKTKNPVARLQNAGIAYVDFGQDRPEHFSVMFTVELSGDLYPSAKAAAQGCFAELVTLVTACHDRPVPDWQQPRTWALIAWTQVHGIADLALRGQLGFRSRKELREFTRLATETFAGHADHW
jgi:AcrR family transcriptional regulator